MPEAPAWIGLRRRQRGQDRILTAIPRPTRLSCTRYGWRTSRLGNRAWTCRSPAGYSHGSSSGRNWPPAAGKLRWGIPAARCQRPGARFGSVASGPGTMPAGTGKGVSVGSYSFQQQDDEDYQHDQHKDIGDRVGENDFAEAEHNASGWLAN